MRASGHGNGGLTKEQAAASHVSDSAAIRVGDRVGYCLQNIRASVGVAEFRKSEEYALLAVIKWSDREMGISAVPLEKLTHFSPDSYASRVRRHRE
jgi:hypothetical protein